MLDNAMPDSLLTTSQAFRLTSSGREAIQAFVVPEEAVRRERPSPVELDTISCDAAQLVSQNSMQPGSGYVLTLRTPADEISVALAARWSVPLATDGWSVGCVFTDQMAAGIMDELAGSRYLERRRDDRIPADVSCRVAMEGAAEHAEGIIRDFSRGGICLAVPGDVVVGDKLRVKLPTSAQPLFVRVRWSRVTGSEQLVGCRAIMDEDYSGEIRAAIRLG